MCGDCDGHVAEVPLSDRQEVRRAPDSVDVTACSAWSAAALRALLRAYFAAMDPPTSRPPLPPSPPPLFPVPRPSPP